MKNTHKDFVQKLRSEGHVVVKEDRRASVREYLTDSERQQIAADMAQQISDAEAKEQDIKDVAAQMKAELATIKASISASASMLNSGYRMMVKPVVVVADFERRTRIFLDPDSGEQVGTEPLQESDFQARVDFE